MTELPLESQKTNSLIDNRAGDLGRGMVGSQLTCRGWLCTLPCRDWLCWAALSAGARVIPASNHIIEKYRITRI